MLSIEDKDADCVEIQLSNGGRNWHFHDELTQK